MDVVQPEDCVTVDSVAMFLEHVPVEHYEILDSDPEWKKSLFSWGNRILDERHQRSVCAAYRLIAKIKKGQECE